MRKILLLLAIFFLSFLANSQVFAAPLQITTKSLPDGIFGVRYGQPIQATGGTLPYYWSIKSGVETLPPGLDNIFPSNFSPYDGFILGTFTKEGVLKKYPFSVRVVDSSSPPQADDQNFSIFINLPQLTITSNGTLPSGMVGDYYGPYTLSATGGVPPYTWSGPAFTQGISVPGLELTSTGIIKGTPTEEGNFRFLVDINGSPLDITTFLNSSAKSFDIEIKTVPLKIKTSAITLEKGRSYPDKLDAQGGTPPYTWSFVTGNLPDGLTLIPDGTFNGVATKEGDYVFIVLVTDSSKQKKDIPGQISFTVKSSCKCSDGTSCGACKTDSPPLYCYDDGTTKTLVNKNEICQGGGQTGGASPSGGISSLGVIPTGKLEVNWPKSPLGTSLLGENGEPPNLTKLIQYLYEWGIGIGGFLAFISLIIAGFQYLTSVGNAGMMKDAMDRIRSAGLGLLLLLASFLILNTINPQLTELKMPTITPGGRGLDPIVPVKVDREIKTCTGATLYSGIDYAQPYGPPISPLSIGKNPPFSPKIEIGSVKMIGDCQLILYQLSDCTGTGDRGSTTLIGDTANVGFSSGGVTLFGCAKLNDLPFKLTQ